MRLTEEQKQLAADNHNLIYGFLHLHSLDIDEYYDICAIALCKAVASYDSSRGSPLSSFAYAVMGNDVKRYWRDNAASARSPVLPTLSLSDSVFAGSGTIVGRGDSGQSPFGQIYSEMFVKSLPPREKKVIELRLDGMSVAEVGLTVGKSPQWVSVQLNKVRDKYIRQMAM